jgi:hypothetical protein
MKKILLASVALTAFAGAAAAEVSFGGDAVLGYNDTAGGDYDGFYWDATLNVSYEQALDNGLTAGVKFNVDIQEDGTAQGSTGGNTNLNADDWKVFIKSDTASLTYGDTTTAAGDMWAAAGDMESDGFTTDWTDFTGTDAVGVLRADVTFGSVSIAASSVLSNDAGTTEMEQTSVAIKADLGAVTVVAAYEDASTVLVEAGDANDDEIFGLSAAFSAAGADFVVAYAEDENSDSTGIKATYPMGDIKVTGYYVSESVGDDNFGLNVAYAAGAIAVALDYQDDQGVTKVALDGSYDMGNGLKLLAGVYDEDGNATATDDGTDTYVAAEYALGGGASLLVSYADANSAGAIADDEVGGPDYQNGTTVAVSFAF